MGFQRQLHRPALQQLAGDVRLFHLDGPQLSSLQCLFLLLAVEYGQPEAQQRWQELTAEQQDEVYRCAGELAPLADAHHRSLRNDVPRLSRAALEEYVRQHPGCLWQEVLHAPAVALLLVAAACDTAPQVSGGKLWGWMDSVGSVGVTCGQCVRCMKMLRATATCLPTIGVLCFVLQGGVEQYCRKAEEEVGNALSGKRFYEQVSHALGLCELSCCVGR